MQGCCGGHAGCSGLSPDGVWVLGFSVLGLSLGDFGAWGYNAEPPKTLRTRPRAQQLPTPLNYKNTKTLTKNPNPEPADLSLQTI